MNLGSGMQYINKENYGCCTHGGSTHTRTIDGAWIHYQGVCKYTLASSIAGAFKVNLMKNSLQLKL